MKKFLITFLLFIFVYSSNAFGNQPKSIGKYKSWEARDKYVNDIKNMLKAKK